MADDGECRLDNACRCLDLARPSKDEWLGMSDDDMRDLSSLIRSVSDPVRLRIIEMLVKGNLYVCLIQHLLDDIKSSKLSYHLDILKKEGLIDSEREGNFVLYSLTDKGRIISERLLSLTSSYPSSG